MAFRADFHLDVFSGGASGNRLPAEAFDGGFLVVRVYVLFHLFSPPLKMNFL
jgi:hypothetical protein